jgi:diguanylate cyclase (GGDEF)-like protein
MKEKHFEGKESLEEENARLRAENNDLKVENVALRTENEELKIDSVTGLPTRRELDKRIAKSRSKEKIDGGREGGPEKEPSNETAVLMLDIDNFKMVNDLYGHPNGDVILRAVADTLREVFRKEDVIMRYGGEEIAVILPKTDAGRLIHKFYDPETGKSRLPVKTTIIYKGKREEVEVTLSGGLAAVGPDGDLHAALAQADQALYAAKEDTQEKDGRVTRGRDRILMYSDDITKKEPGSEIPENPSLDRKKA